MQRIDHPLLSPSLTTGRSICSFHYGQPGQGEKVYIQASLHGCLWPTPSVWTRT